MQSSSEKITQNSSAQEPTEQRCKFTPVFVLKCMAFVAVVAVLSFIMNFLLAQPSTVNVLLNDFKTNPSTDTLVLGDSYGEVGLTPSILTDYCESGGTVDMARMTTIPERFYYLTKTANKDGQIKRVILEMSPACWVGEMNFAGGTDNNELFQDLTLEAKAEYFVNECLDKKFTNVLFDFNIGTDTCARVPKAIPVKMSEQYLQKQDCAVGDINRILQLDKFYSYGGYGQRRGESYDPNYNKRFTLRHWDFSEDKLNKTTMRAFDNLVNYCKEQNIQLDCVLTAKAPYHLQHENYDAVHDFFTQLCDSYNVSFYDLNYIKAQYFPRTDADFVDVDGHMFGQTADRQTQVLGRLLSGKITEFFQNTDQVSTDSASLNSEDASKTVHISVTGSSDGGSSFEAVPSSAQTSVQSIDVSNLFYKTYDEVLQNICYASGASCEQNTKG